MTSVYLTLGRIQEKKSENYSGKNDNTSLYQNKTKKKTEIQWHMKKKNLYNRK